MFISLSKKSIIAAMSALILIIFICGEFSAAGQNNIPAKTNAERLEFISSLNIKSENVCCEEKSLLFREFSERFTKTIIQFRKKQASIFRLLQGAKQEFIHIKSRIKKNSAIMRMLI